MSLGSRTPRRISGLLAALVVASAACAPAVGARAAGGPGDPQLAAIAMALNQGEITTNQSATSRATMPLVRQFAERMVTEHAAALEQMRAIGVTPADHPLATQITQGAQQTAAVLQQYEGPAFDQVHMTSQVDLHQYALATIDDYLIPNARDSRLRAMLEQNRAMVQAHLDLARQVQSRTATP